MSEQCTFCPYDFPDHVQTCPHCGRPSRFPNVVALDKPDKRKALDDHYQLARSQAHLRQTEAVVLVFEKEVEDNAKVCIVRHLWEVERLSVGQNQLYATFYKEVRAGSRLPEENDWEKWRQKADPIFFPNYHEEIRFGCLSMVDTGPAKYGEAVLVLDESMIQHRTTLFATNSARFVRDNPTVMEPPLAMQAVWEDRAKLAVAKLADNIGMQTASTEFPAILLKDAPHDGDEFIEAHVYGSISMRTVKKVTFAHSAGITRTDAFFDYMERELAKMRILMERH